MVLVEIVWWTIIWWAVGTLQDTDWSMYGYYLDNRRRLDQ
jgi:hypothetical protein